MLKDLSQRLRRNIAYRDMISTRTHTGSADGSFNECVRSFPLEELRRLFALYPVEEDKQIWGYLVLEPKVDERTADDSLIGAALLGIRLAVRREIARQKKEQAFREDLMSDLLSEKTIDRMEADDRLKLLGLSGDLPCLALAIEFLSPSPEDETSRPGCKEDIVRTFFPTFLHTHRSGQLLCALFPSRGMGLGALRGNLDSMASLFLQRVSEERPFIGVGSLVQSPMDLRLSMEEAQRALLLRRLNGNRDNLLVWSELGELRVLGLVAETEEGRALHDACLRRVADYDEGHNMDLLQTLACLDEQNWNLRATAKRLSFHINTVKYRCSKLKELLGMDLKSSAVRFNIALALRLHAIYEGRNETERRSDSP
ncbi:hypothetical protein EII26_04960 [Fretibacterium sp. OH1220_COT-178]|nr:hypothetical protein EII26_04960 [Fretibacterium sp. OH1220_COT-178]